MPKLPSVVTVMTSPVVPVYNRKVPSGLYHIQRLPATVALVAPTSVNVRFQMFNPLADPAMLRFPAPRVGPTVMLFPEKNASFATWNLDRIGWVLFGPAPTPT